MIRAVTKPMTARPKIPNFLLLITLTTQTEKPIETPTKAPSPNARGRALKIKIRMYGCEITENKRTPKPTNNPPRAPRPKNGNGFLSCPLRVIGILSLLSSSRSKTFSERRNPTLLFTVDRAHQSLGPKASCSSSSHLHLNHSNSK